MRIRLSVFCASVLLSAACGGDSLVLTVDPTTFSADGMSVLTLNADVVFRGSALADGKTVNFRASTPSLFETREEISEGGPGTRPPGASEVSTSARGGKAQAFLLAPVEAMAVTLEASYTTVNKDVLKGTVEFVFGAPPLIAAGGNVGGATQAVTPHFQINCEHQNIGAFVHNRPDIVVACALVLEDAAGKSWPHTPVKLLAEAGSLGDTPADAEHPRRITYTVADPPPKLPLDVRPMAAEEPYTEGGATLIPGALEQNPRDGLVTLLVAARGHEAYADSNHNGRYDVGELFIDEGEPFLDVDDDGVFNAAKGDLACCDNNDNAKVDGPNGRFDDDVWLGRMTHILWTGPVSQSFNRSAIAPNGYVIPALGQKSFSLRVVDAHFNPVAALDTSDTIEFALTGSKLDFQPPGEPSWPLSEVLGMTLDDAYPRFMFGQESPSFTGLVHDGTALVGREWTFTLADTRQAGSSYLANCYDYSVVATVTHTPGAGSGFVEQTATISASGKLANEANNCP